MDYIYIHRSDLRNWQLETLKIQQDIQKLFENSSIDCWCGGGTLIGAVRNKGFLYWDNDLDVFFMFRDYKKIILTLLKEQFFDRFDMYYFRDNYWQKNENLTKIINCNKVDETLLDFEIEELSNGMFKLFSKRGIPVVLHDNNYNNAEQFVKIKYRAIEHLTRCRLAYQRDNIINGASYSVMPNVCMLPMIEMHYTSYLIFLYRFMLNRIFSHLADIVEYPEVTLDKLCQLKVKPPERAMAQFIQRPTHKYSQKAKRLFSVLVESKIHFLKIYKKKVLKNYSGKVIAYKPTDFRFIVRPFPIEDVFPLRKVKFENVVITIPNNAHEVLHTQFGNYMYEPEIENRIAYPFFFENRMD